MRLLGLSIAISVIIVFCDGCRHYRLVRETGLRVQSIAVDAVQNRTDEPRLGAYTKNLLTELLTLDSTLAVRTADAADCTIATTVLSYHTQNIGESRRRSTKKNLQNYRTTVLEVSVVIEYTVTSTTDGRILIPSRRVTGVAEFSELADMETVKQDGFRRAIDRACREIVDQVATER